MFQVLSRSISIFVKLALSLQQHLNKGVKIFVLNGLHQGVGKKIF